MTGGILLAGGKGLRVGGEIPKQYIMAGDKPVIYYALKAMLESTYIQKLVIVAETEWQEFILPYVKEIDGEGKFLGFAAPGLNRQLSIYSALAAYEGKLKAEDFVLVHDAARPNLTEKILEALTKAAEQHDGAMPVLPMKDTVYEVDEAGKITALLKRERIKAGQAPEIFVYGKYMAANECLLSGDEPAILSINGSSEPAILYGMDIVTVPGDENNFKITTLKDLQKFMADR